MWAQRNSDHIDLPSTKPIETIAGSLLLIHRFNQPLNFFGKRAHNDQIPRTVTSTVRKDRSRVVKVGRQSPTRAVAVIEQVDRGTVNGDDRLVRLRQATDLLGRGGNQAVGLRRNERGPGR